MDPRTGQTMEQALARVVDVDPDLRDMMSSLLAQHRQGSVGWDPAQLDERLWRALDEVGLSRLTGSEKHGGSGATWVEAGALLGAVAGIAGAVPIAEHDLLAGWALEEAGLDAPTVPTTMALLDADGVAHSVPWAGQVQAVVLVRDYSPAGGPGSAVALVPADALDIVDGRNLAGSPRATVRAEVDAVAWTPVGRDLAPELRLRGALARAAQICGALDQVVDLSVAHTTARVQFGRPLARFQAVQQLVADSAAEAALARAATDAALATAAAQALSGPAAELAVAVARSCAGHAASTVVRNAHQVHGAIGTTLEHQLHEFTGPILAWRSEYGSMRSWDDHLTAVAVEAGSDVWSVVTGGAPRRPGDGSPAERHSS